MPKMGLRIVVEQDSIIISQPGSDSVAVYFKPSGQSYLVAKDAPVGTPEFRTQAWEAACDKARELGWIV
jgi:hypothetical protein